MVAVEKPEKERAEKRQPTIADLRAAYVEAAARTTKLAEDVLPDERRAISQRGKPNTPAGQALKKALDEKLLASRALDAAEKVMRDAAKAELAEAQARLAALTIPKV